MSRLSRHAIHISLVFLCGVFLNYLDSENKDWVGLFYLVSMFTQYVFLSPILRFKFWIRFMVSILFWMLSLTGGICIIGLFAFRKGYGSTLVETLGLIAYCLIVVLLYEAFSSNSPDSKETWLGRNLKRIFRKMIDPHDQGIQ